jgi:hypothetical protein
MVCWESNYARRKHQRYVELALEKGPDVLSSSVNEAMRAERLQQLVYSVRSLVLLETCLCLAIRGTLTKAAPMDQHASPHPGAFCRIVSAMLDCYDSRHG